MNNVFIQRHKTPYGELLIGAFNEQLCLCDWQYRRMRTSIDKRIQNALNAKYVEQTCPVIDETIRQLGEYFASERKLFDLPLLMLGTEFQQTVWKNLLIIPYGSTSSYLELANNIGNEKAVRAVATANGANAMSIVIPCHRVIGSNGELTGYAGGLPVKKKLLALEAS
ncbi:MAG: cysteine methyltransferase [Cycloclasticus sp.]|nr:MAG: cysteine methyltransferase [Cycloclasticus sp.]